MFPGHGLEGNERKKASIYSSIPIDDSSSLEMDIGPQPPRRGINVGSTRRQLLGGMLNKNSLNIRSPTSDSTVPIKP